MMNLKTLNTPNSKNTQILYSNSNKNLTRNLSMTNKGIFVLKKDLLISNLITKTKNVTTQENLKKNKNEFLLTNNSENKFATLNSFSSSKNHSNSNLKMSNTKTKLKLVKTKSLLPVKRKLDFDKKDIKDQNSIKKKFLNFLKNQNNNNNLNKNDSEKNKILSRISDCITQKKIEMNKRIKSDNNTIPNIISENKNSQIGKYSHLVKNRKKLNLFNFHKKNYSSNLNENSDKINLTIGNNMTQGKFTISTSDDSPNKTPNNDKGSSKNHFEFLIMNTKENSTQTNFMLKNESKNNANSNWMLNKNLKENQSFKNLIFKNLYKNVVKEHTNQVMESKIKIIKNEGNVSDKDKWELVTIMTGRF